MFGPAHRMMPQCAVHLRSRHNIFVLVLTFLYFLNIVARVVQSRYIIITAGMDSPTGIINTTQVLTGESEVQICVSPVERNALSAPCSLTRLHTSLSIVVDDVDDAECSPGILTPASCDESLTPDRPPLARNPSAASLNDPDVETTVILQSADCARLLTKQKSDERLRQIKGEVENRKSEFARLLEEHAQVVARLKAMETGNDLRAPAITNL